MKYGKEFFWGDPMDFRFLIVSKLSEITVENVLDVGCNMGLILNNVDSKFKIGIDIDFNSLKAGKKTYPDIEFVFAYFSTDKWTGFFPTMAARTSTTRDR